MFFSQETNFFLLLTVNKRLKELLQRSGNRLCADCGAPDPKWASANIGVFICLKCCGIHRSLGIDVSKVLSVTSEEWSVDEIDFMVEVGGNSYANAIYEAFLSEGFPKPGPESSSEERTRFIRSKYELQEFLKPSLRIVSLTSSRNSFQSSDSGKDLDDSLDSEASKRTVDMIEFIGTLKVKVVKGTNLAIRDMLSSDPYVVLVLGQQKVQTSVMDSNLNPVWNEELQLSVPQRYGPLKLQVFDQDTFFADDIMGEAEVDLQPLITAATAFGDADLLGNMQIGKWLKSYDNALMKDSTINIVDGKVKQDVSLKLQNVESGEIDLELEWIPMNQ
uniref:ADP-ribosylation factor GTPase-activating protein AGD12 n=1 Tax=Anthurium amnicola TaxID=1678845 RepID=A0A1D1XXA1_9ARAE